MHSPSSAMTLLMPRWQQTMGTAHTMFSAAHCSGELEASCSFPSGGTAAVTHAARELGVSRWHGAHRLASTTAQQLHMSSGSVLMQGNKYWGALLSSQPCFCRK